MLHDHERWEQSNYSHQNHNHHSAGTAPSARPPSPSLPPNVHHDAHFARHTAPFPGDVIRRDPSAGVSPTRGGENQHRSRVYRQSALWPPHSSLQNKQQPRSASSYNTNNMPPGGLDHNPNMQNPPMEGISDSYHHQRPLRSGSQPVYSPLPSAGQPSNYMQSKQTAISNRKADAARTSQIHTNMQSSLYDSGQYNYVGQSRLSANQSSKECAECLERHRVFHESEHTPEHRPVAHEEHDTLHEVAHGLHFASIALLGFLVLEVSYFHFSSLPTTF